MSPRRSDGRTDRPTDGPTDRPTGRPPAAAVPDLYCSFCRRHASVVDKLVGGPGVTICDRCVAACNDVLAGRQASAFAGWPSLGDDALLEALRSAGHCADALEGSLRDQVRTLRGRGISWQRIGDALGVSRQAAQQRFGAAVA